MNKQFILNKYSKAEDKLLISRILDKYQYATTRNKICSTNFLNLAEQALANSILSQLKIKNYIIYGAYPNSERNIFIFYPEKFNLDIVQANFDNLIGIIRITLPKELHQSFSHREYLGGLMKLGIEREKIGDILTFDDGADIIVVKDMLDYFLNNLPYLTRFKKSVITSIPLQNLRIMQPKKEEIEITIPSLRLDSIVSELLHVSRSKACEVISSERVFINFELETKTNKFLKPNDILTIRGSGRYEIDQILGNTRKGNSILKVYKIGQ